MANKVVFITSGTSYTVPADFGALISFEAIGAGGHGNGGSGFGGGGGAYAKIVTLAGIAPGSVYTIQIGVADGTNGSGTSPTANTWLKDGATLVSEGGASATTNSGAGGTTANSVGSTKFAGGNGADSRGGGGGAAGPNGAGGNASTTTGGTGDNGSGGTGGASGVSGGNGAEWTATAGGTAGAGGGGGGSFSNSGSGGLYGAGGGGAASNPGVGQAGIIVFTYAPFAPLISAGISLAVIVSIANTTLWPYAFTGGQQPYAQRKLPPSFLDVRVDEPPYQHRERTPQQTAIAVQAGQADPWIYASLGGLQPYMQRQLSPGILGVRNDNPPFGIPPVWLSSVTQAWQPEIWPPVFMGGRQAYEPRKLNPQITAVQVDNPPFTHRERLAVTASLKTPWQPETWPYSYTGGRQPYDSAKLPPVVTDVQVDNPPFTHRGRVPTTPPITFQWQPEIWPYSYTGGKQPYDQRKLPPVVQDVPETNPPFAHRSRIPAYMALVDAWRPDPWPPTFAGGRQPYAPSRLPPFITDVEVDNPPFGIPNINTFSVVVTQWQPPVWPPVFMGGRQAYEPRKITPGVPGVSVDNPPFRHPSRTPEKPSITWQWQPDPWIYSAIGGRQPYEPRKLSPGVPGFSVDNPPFRHPSKLPGMPSLTYQWQPPIWPYQFMGGKQPYVMRWLTPSIENVNPTPNAHLLIKNEVVRVRYLKNYSRG